MPNDNSNQPKTPTQPTSEEVIQNAWKEAYRLLEAMRGVTDEGITFKITEILGNEKDTDHHIVIVADGCEEAAIIRTEMSGEYRTRFLMLPSPVVKAIQHS